MAIISVDTARSFQTIESFGASGAWWAQVVGGWDNTDPLSGKSVRERIAELLYSSRDGIGLECYRYNLGGGSKNSGSCTFSGGNRGAESFDISDTQYDFTRDANAVRMLRECVKYGADDVVLFSNSPPEWWTKNHKACLDTPWLTNLARKNEAAFVRYLLDCAEHFISEGIPVKYISPVNEPLWVWTEKHGQEGCHYNPSGVKRLMRLLATELEKRPALKGVKISGAENGDIRWFNKTYCRVMLGDEIIRRNIDAVDTHSYCLHSPLGFMNDRVAYLKRYRRYMDKKYPGVPVKISEWTHMQGGGDSGMDSALVQARVMHEDLSVLNVSSWQHWVAVSNGNYCDGLIYMNQNEKTYELTKRYYAFGNFTAFVRRGSVRVGAECDDNELLVTAFINGGKTVLVIVNPTDKAKNIELRGCPDTGCGYVTSDEESLTPFAVQGGTASLARRSVTTIVCEQA